jgi:hypothetical protein
MIFRVVDIETIPDLRIWSPGKPKWELTPRESQLALEIPFAGVQSVEAFPPPHAHRVVAIATLDIRLNIDDDTQPRYIYSGCKTACRWGYTDDCADANEMALLSQFSADVTETGAELNFVSWNGRTFDLPVLSMRAFQLGIPWAWYYGNRDMRYRYSSEGHLDLMDFLADFGAGKNMKLGDAAKMIGLPGKIDISGASVHGLYLETQNKSLDEQQVIKDKVGRYCLQDVVETAVLFLRSRYHMGKISAEEFDDSLALLLKDLTIVETLPVEWEKVKLLSKNQSGV